MDLKLISKAVSSVIKDAIAPMLKRIESLESIPVVKPEPLPDVEKMISDAVAALPKAAVPEPLPDIQKMIDDAIAAIPAQVAPEPLPDIAKMISDAMPKLEPVILPDIQKMVDDAVALLPNPANPEPLPDIYKMISEAVAAIPAPKQAENGRDGTDIDILPGIDFEKSYQRGIYATHNGGLWKSYANTVGERGWECIVRGISKINVSRDNYHDFSIGIQLSDGTEVKKSLTFEAMIYRGVYKEGSEYSAGDTATWAGSLWHCNEKTAEKPGDGKSWTLAVKRGSNGRDAKTIVDVSGGVKI